MNPNLINLGNLLPAGERYSFTFDGKTIPEPANLHDDYATRASPARTRRSYSGRSS